MARYLIALIAVTALVYVGHSVLRSDDSEPPVAESTEPAATAPAPVTPPSAKTAPPIQAARKIFENESRGEPITDKRIRQALELFHEGRKEAAIEMLEALVRSEPSNSSALTELAMLYALDPKTADRAAELFRKALDANPENVAAVEELAQLELARKGPAGVDLVLSEAVGKHPESAAIAGAYGKALMEQGRGEEALSYLKKASSQGNSSLDIQAALADAYASRGDAKGQAEALRALVANQERFLARYPNDPELASGMRYEITRNTISYARALIQSRDYDGAESALRAAAERNAPPQELELLYRELQRAKSGA